MELPQHKVLARAAEGPFLCGPCEHFSSAKSQCSHPYIVEHFGPDVDFYDCCDFFEKDKKRVSLAGALRQGMQKAND